MELAINEVKVQAKKLLKTIQTGHALPPQTPPAIATLTLQSIKLKHCLAIVAQQLGFENWRHAQNILSGSDMPFKTLDMGSLFYPKGCDYFINE